MVPEKYRIPQMHTDIFKIHADILAGICVYQIFYLCESVLKKCFSGALFLSYEKS